MVTPDAMKQTLKEALYWLLQSGACVNFKLRALATAGAVPILNVHRVGEASLGGYAPLDSGIFDELIGWLAQRFHIVAFGELEAPAKPDKPQLVLSFDDGYKDFIEVAVPILDKRRIRVNHNIVPGCVESGRPPMNVELQDFIASAPAALLRETPLPGLPSGADPDRRERSCLRASAALKAKPIVEQKREFAELAPAFARFDNFRPTAMMSLEHIRQLTAAHEFGAHSFEHASMEAENDAYLRADAQKCTQFFETKLGFTPQIYAFPNGSARSEQARIVAQAGYRHVLLVGEDYSRADAWLHPRFTLHAKSSAEAHARALGWFRRSGAVDKSAGRDH
jgi:peptidoglycan/xylan/chitin deacetylase (PgdA/CDA1 family)